MNRGKNATSSVASVVVLAATLFTARSALAEVPLVDHDGWRLSTDGRVNTFLSVAQGTGLPEGQVDNLGAGTTDTVTASGALHSTRIRNGFIMNILGFTGQKEVSPNFRVTTRVGLWMNITGTRTKNAPALVDPRELYGKIEGNWGSFLAGSHLSLFGRGGILVDADIAHDYGVGYPCSVRDVSGGGCGMIAFGAPFPGFEPFPFYRGYSADFFDGTGIDAGPQCFGDQLRPQADAQDGLSQRDRGADQIELLTDKRQIVIGRHRAAHDNERSGAFDIRGFPALVKIDVLAGDTVERQ